MWRFFGESRANDKGVPSGIAIKKDTQGLQQKGEVFLIGFPTAYGDNLILFGDSGVEFEDIGLDGMGNAVDLSWVVPKPGREILPNCSGMWGFDSNSREKF